MMMLSRVGKWPPVAFIPGVENMVAPKTKRGFIVVM